jgi:SOS-response transcriptional repressor LexA
MTHHSETVSTRRSRLKEWIDTHCNKSQATFIEITGINQGELSGLLKEKSFGEKKARKLEELAGMPKYWLDSKGSQVKEAEQTYAKSNVSLSSQPDNFKKLEMVVIPLIAFDRAGEWQSALKDHHPEDGEIMTKPITGQDLFAVAVPDDTMRSGFWEDEYLVVDPHMEAEHKDFVLASIGNLVVFRQLWNDAGEWLLKPLNERYDNRPLADNRIIGVVRRKVKETDYR